MSVATTVWLGILSSAIVAVAGYLIARASRSLDKRVGAPVVTLKDKVRLAEQIEPLRQSLARLDHLASHPKDLYLHLYKRGLVALIGLCGGLYFMPYAQVVHDAEGSPGVNNWGFFAIAFPFVGLLFAFLAMREASTLSDKNIARTRSTIQAALDDALTKVRSIADLAVTSASPSQPEAKSDQE